jgi:cobalt-zinc-cadmium efflux system membrane fusion protein
MSEKYNSEEIEHHENYDAELARLKSLSDAELTDPEQGPKRKIALPWIVAIAIVGLIGLISLGSIAYKQSGKSEVKVEAEPASEGPEKGEPNEVKLSPEVLASAGIQTETVTQRPAVALITVGGTVEVNPQETQKVTSLVSGRVERVFVSIGDRVSAGQSVATILSPEIAESYGKWRTAVTNVELAKNNLNRVKRAENQSAILQAKARLDEAEATLKRTKRLIELGAGAGKDLISAETTFRTAKADYDFQRNIPLNKEIQEAESALKSAEVDAVQQKQSLQALGANVSSPNAEVKSVASLSLRSPVSGIVTARMVSGGAGVQAGTSLFTISNISTVWIIASVPENQMPLLRVGTPAEIRVAAFGDGVITGRVSYIDPQLNEDTRTGRVRIEVANASERLKAGMFVEVRFQAGTGTASGEELVVPSTAVHRLGERSVVFIPKDGEVGVFEVREIEIGSAIEGYHRVISGLELGDKVVTKGSFTLKTQMQKGELGEE